MDAVAFFIGILLSATILKEFSLGQIVINFEAEGDSLTKTGIRKYSIYSDPRNGQDTTTISCSSPISVPARLSIMKNHVTLNESTTFGDHPGGIRVSTNGINYKTTSNGIKGASPNRPTKGTLAGVYVCRLLLMFQIQNQTKPFVTMTSEMVINTTRQTFICSSSVGQSGYVGEIISLYCTGKYYNSRYRDYSIGWLDTSDHHNVLLSHQYRQFTCGYNNSVPVCRSPQIEVYPFLNITITKVRKQRDLSVTKYTCRSRPPRLMHWEVIGKDGNILDPGNMHRSVKGGTTVSIFQSAEVTYLRISERVPGRNCIHTIKCSTYDTNPPVGTSVSLAPSPVPGTDCPKNADSTTEQTATTTSAYESTVKFHTDEDKFSTLSGEDTSSVKEDSTTRPHMTVNTNSYRSTFSLHTRKDESSTLPAQDSTSVKGDLTTRQTPAPKITKTTAHGSTFSLHINNDTSSIQPIKRIISGGRTEIGKEYQEDPVAIRPFKKDELDQNEDTGFSTGNIPVAFIALALLVAVGYIIFKKRRAPSKTTHTSDDINNNVESEIEFHEYPSRLSFSEAFGYTEKSREADKTVYESQNKYEGIPCETELHDNPAYQPYSDLLDETSSDVDYVPSLEGEENGDFPEA